MPPKVHVADPTTHGPGAFVIGNVVKNQQDLRDAIHTMQSDSVRLCYDLVNGDADAMRFVAQQAGSGARAHLDLDAADDYLNVVEGFEIAAMRQRILNAVAFKTERREVRECMCD